MSVAAARRLGVPEEKWVYLHGHADRPSRTCWTAPTSASATRRNRLWQRRFGWPGSASTTSRRFDLYSCFPFPVFAVCDEFGLAADDPRGLTLTGGLPYFGGPGNNYSLHGIAETVAEMRDKPGAFGLVGANGGIMSKYSVGVYSTDARRLGGRPQQGAAGRDRRAAEGAGHPQRRRARRPSRPTRCATTGRSRPASSSAGSTPTAAGSWRTTEDEDLVALMSDGDPLGHADRGARPTATVQPRDAGRRPWPGRLDQRGELAGQALHVGGHLGFGLVRQPEQHLGDAELGPVRQLLGHPA